MTGSALGNGGPFVLKYPGGDPAAKGVLARLDSSLKPARETRLQVVKEDLSIRFEPDRWPMREAKKGAGQTAPLVAVTAAYLITNTTAETIEVDFGFPILRGIYLSPFSMFPRPEAQVRIDGTNYLRPEIISNSAIYGILRRKAGAAIERALQANTQLLSLVKTVQSAPPHSRAPAQKVLADYLTETLKWPVSDAALLVEYASLQPVNAPPPHPSSQVVAVGKSTARPELLWGERDSSLLEATSETPWATAVIGEQKATQWLTLLAGRLEPAGAGSYEAIFQAWGGDVRERSVDLATGKVRPREISLASNDQGALAGLAVMGESDPTVYARLDYLDANKNLTATERASWQSVLKHLPVTFTFAPMNLLHYRVSFAPGSQRTVTVSYQQYAYLDTATPNSYQMAYVVHPASLWDSFGPIHLTVTTPAGTRPVGSLPFQPLRQGKPETPAQPRPDNLTYHSYAATLIEKTGELFIGLDVADWQKAATPPLYGARRP
jgi:hypothetical protein